jgi:hypothetical protein
MLRHALVPLVLALAPIAALRADLVAHLPFDGNIEDVSGNANHGTFAGDVAPTFTDGFDGSLASAVLFDGVNDIVSLAPSATLPISDLPAFSVAMWVRGGVQTDRRVFSEGSSTNNTPLFNLGTHNTGANGALNSFLRPGPGHRQTAFIAYDLTWHHIAWVERTGRVDVYIDGVRDPVNLSYTSTGPRAVNRIAIGGILRATAGSFFAGSIDDVRLYNHAISEAEVQALIPTPGCPDEGDTHCRGLDIVHDGLGGVTATATGEDDGGDADLLYTFTLLNSAGFFRQIGPQSQNSIQVALGIDTWTIRCAVDDDLGCFDKAPDATCESVLVVSPPPQLIAHYPFDGSLQDATPNGNHGTFVGDVAALFTEGFDGTPDGAVLFDGVDDFVQATQKLGLPIYNSAAYSVAMWVKGGPQGDKRVFSEGSTTDNTPLVNIGTDNTGATGKLDIFIRHGTTLVNHIHSNREAFDNAWHHIAWVDDGGQGRFYIDGVVEASSISYTRPSAFTLNTTTIGGILRAAACCFFAGAIDDVRVYNFALSADEVQALIPEPPGCPETGDTHCSDLAISGPAGGSEGSYTATMTAADESGDAALNYLFFFDNGAGTRIQVGPQTQSSATAHLTPGQWTVSASVDDSYFCRDAAPDASCTRSFEVLTEPRRLISAWSFDGNLLDSAPSGNDGTFSGGNLVFVPGRECTTPGAIDFDGTDDIVVAESISGLPLTTRRVFSIALWVRGLPQPDRRVFSEGNTQGLNSPLYNLGTDSTGATAALDFFYRTNDGVTPRGHLLSQGPVFDGSWHHIAWIDDEGRAVLYIDGQKDGMDFSYTRGAYTPTALTIGAILRAATCCHFNGEIDDVRIYNYAISEDEILALYGDGAEEKCCPAAGDTHCRGLTIAAPEGNTAGTYTLTAVAADDSGDAIRYTFSADDGAGTVLTAGPQTEISASFELGLGSWTLAVAVDDDPDCDDAAVDASCLTGVDVVPCPPAGDTHCLGLTVSGPEGGFPGAYLLTAAARDDSGDGIRYTFSADDGAGTMLSAGPQAESNTSFELGVGSWMLSVSVDDDPDCPDAAEDARCDQSVTVVPAGGGQISGDCNQDGKLDIADASCIFGVLFLGTPEEFPCGDGTPADPANVALIDWQPDSRIDLSDGVAALNFLFSGGPAHPAGEACRRIVGCADACAP